MNKNLWWGYLHKNGTLQVKRYFGKLDIIEAIESPFVSQVSGPWECDSREEALIRLEEELQ